MKIERQPLFVLMNPPMIGRMLSAPNPKTQCEQSWDGWIHIHIHLNSCFPPLLVRKKSIADALAM
jgi:hypothetical protein